MILHKAPVFKKLSGVYMFSSLSTSIEESFCKKVWASAVHSGSFSKEVKLFLMTSS